MLGFGDRSERIVVDLEQRRVVSGSLSLSPPQGFCHLMWVPTSNAIDCSNRFSYGLSSNIKIFKYFKWDVFLG